MMAQVRVRDLSIDTLYIAHDNIYPDVRIHSLQVQDRPLGRVAYIHIMYEYPLGTFHTDTLALDQKWNVRPAPQYVIQELELV